MPRLKSKQFKKKYASSMDNVPQQGVWSGRGIAIPVAGAIGGGDDYIQKIGRGKRPYYQGDNGTPSQGADSTFSSYLARVNNGYEEFEGGSMFPEQEEEEEDIYALDGVSPIKSRKLPKNFRVRSRTTGISEIMFKDDEIIENSQYSLSRIFEQSVLDGGVPELDIDAPRTEDIITDILGDAAVALADTVTGDVSGLVLVIPAVVTNMVQIHSSTSRAGELLEELAENPSDKIVMQLDAIQHDIIRDIIDLAQRVIEALPAPAIPEEWVSVVGGFLTQQALTQLIATAAASGVKTFAETYADFLDRMPRVIKFIFEYGPGINSLGISFVISRGIEAAGQIHRATREYREVQSGRGQIARVGDEVITSDQIELEGQPYTKEDLYRAILTGDESTMSNLRVAETRKMTISELRKFIKESIYPDYGSYHPPLPTGYEYRDAPVVVSKEEEGKEFDVLDSYDDVAVAFKSDAGVSSYQVRNKGIKEAALRNLIRKDILTILDENKKKENY